MVNRLISLFLLLPIFLFAGEFTASVNRNQISMGESLILSLSLKEASAKGNPVLDSLKNSFSIQGQQQSFSTVMMNGKVTSSTTWKLTLVPHNEGKVVIPAVSIETAEGTLSSKPITIQIVKSQTSARSDTSDAKDMTLSTKVSNAAPYKNEPFIYTIRIVSKKNLANIDMQKVSLENALIEARGEPRIHNQVMDGVNVGVIEFDYLVTPVKAGSLKIPSIVIQGVTPIKRKPQNRGFADDEFDLFSMLQGFDRMAPFALKTDEVVLDVQPAIVDMNPWLPAKSLKIEEIWNEAQSLKVGEPLNRGFKIVAEGLKSTQLPNLNDLQTDNDHFKIYADKPELQDDEKDGTIKSYRKEQYTLIPQQPGTLTLPEISVVWWDTAKKEKVIARIPSKTLEILSLAEESLKNVMASPVEESLTAPESQGLAVQRDPIVYVLMAGLAVLLLMAMVWGLFLQQKISRLTKKPVPLKNADVHEKYSLFSDAEEKPLNRAKKREKLPDLNPT